MKAINLLLIVLLVTVSGASYAIGRKTGSDSGYKAGAASSTALAEQNYNNYLAAADDLVAMQEEYNALVDDYNTLRTEAMNYVNANQYQPRQSISCTTNSFGSFGQTTYTTCY